MNNGIDDLLSLRRLPTCRPILPILFRGSSILTTSQAYPQGSSASGHSESGLRPLQCSARALSYSPWLSTLSYIGCSLQEVRYLTFCHTIRITKSSKRLRLLLWQDFRIIFEVIVGVRAEPITWRRRVTAVSWSGGILWILIPRFEIMWLKIMIIGKRINSHRAHFKALGDPTSAWSRPVSATDASPQSEGQTCHRSLVRSGHSRGQVVGRMGILIPATSPNKQAFVCLACLACLLYQRSRTPGDYTSLIQTPF